MPSYLTDCVSPFRIVSVYVGQSQHVKGVRAPALGWEPKTVPVVMNEWTEEGVKAALDKL
jgi:hypothetical protein